MTSPGKRPTMTLSAPLAQPLEPHSVRGRWAGDFAGTTASDLSLRHGRGKFLSDTAHPEAAPTQTNIDPVAINWSIRLSHSSTPAALLSLSRDALAFHRPACLRPCRAPLTTTSAPRCSSCPQPAGADSMASFRLDGPPYQPLTHHLRTSGST